MQHPTKLDRNGEPFIQRVNIKTVNSGKAQKLGYIPVPDKATAPPAKPVVIPDIPEFDLTGKAETEVKKPKK